MSATREGAPVDSRTAATVQFEQIAAAVGTPTWVYDARAIRSACRALHDAFGGTPHAIHYALKANSSLALVQLIAAENCGADANSMGEVDLARRAGIEPRRIVFTGVGKRADELERAVALDLAAINVESPGELERLSGLAADRGAVARVALRVNPDIDARSHPYISTGLRDSKFGVPIQAAPDLFREIASRPSLRAVGIHVHIGSQITAIEPLEQAARAVVSLAGHLRDLGVVDVEHLDFGGGLGIAYDGGGAPDPVDYVRTLVRVAAPSGLSLVIEPGRLLVGAAGALVARVVDVKQFPGHRRFVVLDAGMTDLMRPALYNAFHRIEPVVRRPGPIERVDIVGPICESTDIFGRDRELPPVEIGDLVVIRDAGAYGAAMASNYLRRPLAPEVLVDEGAWRVIRRRQTLDDMLALET
jgi:diaminopimelate decarboxylase